MPFRTLAQLNALLFAGLCLGLLAAPGAFAVAFGLPPTPGAEVMARRAGAIFAGLAPLYLALATTPEARARRAIARASLLMMAAQAALGLVELAAGRVGLGILIPVTVEVAFGLLYLPHARRRR